MTGTDTPRLYYWCVVISSLWQCTHHARGRSCPSPKACTRGAVVLVRDYPLPRRADLSVERRNHSVISGYGDGTHGDIVLDTGDGEVISAWQAPDRAAAVAWLVRRIPTDEAEWAIEQAEDATRERVAGREDS